MLDLVNTNYNIKNYFRLENTKKMIMSSGPYKLF